MTELDAERLSDILSLGIGKLMDKQKVFPPLPPQFWVELGYFIRNEARGFTVSSGKGNS